MTGYVRTEKQEWYCDGVADDVQIQSAIDSQSNNGWVELGPGTYDISHSVVMKTGVDIRGASRSRTVLRLQNSATVDATHGNVLYCGNVEISDITISNLSLDGNLANNLGLVADGHAGYGAYVRLQGQNIRFHHVNTYNCRQVGIAIKAGSSKVTKNCWYTNGVIKNNGYNDISFAVWDNTSEIHSCGAMENYTGGTTGDISLDTYSSNSVPIGTNMHDIAFANNIVEDISGTLGSSTNPYSWTGCRLEDSYRCSVIGNIFLGARNGIVDDSHNGGRNLFLGNRIITKDPSSGGEAAMGFQIYSTYNLIANNEIVHKAGHVNRGIAFYLNAGAHNTFCGNIIKDAGTSSRAFYEINAADYNSFFNNEWTSITDVPIITGANTKWWNNVGLLPSSSTTEPVEIRSLPI